MRASQPRGGVRLLPRALDLLAEGMTRTISGALALSVFCPPLILVAAALGIVAVVIQGLVSIFAGVIGHNGNSRP